MYNQSFLPELSQTLRAASGGDSTPTVLVPVTSLVGNLARGEEIGDQHICTLQENIYTFNHACDVYREYTGSVPTLASRMGTGGNNVACMISDYKVRRITPTECERLQGLPDGYTLIDDKKCSDSARYKALGNGMAQPCADFVMQRIAEVSATKDRMAEMGADVRHELEGAR